VIGQGASKPAVQEADFGHARAGPTAPSRGRSDQSLNSSGIDAIVSQLEAAGVPQHVRVDLHIEAGDLAGTLNHRLKTSLRERCPALADEYERRLGLLAL
jgi:hypothetical protein